MDDGWHFGEKSKPLYNATVKYHYMGDIQSETKFGFKLNGKLYITNYLRHTEFYTMRHTKYVFLPYLNPTQAIWFPNNRVGTRCNDERNKLLFSHK